MRDSITRKSVVFMNRITVRDDLKVIAIVERVKARLSGERLI